MAHHPANEFTILVDGAMGYFQFLRDAGIDAVDCDRETRAIIDAWQGRQPLPRTAKAKPETLEAIREELGDCRRCRLCHTRCNIVYGKGSARARLMIVGDMPGADEDQSGDMLQGEAGRLLAAILKASKQDLGSVYLCNILKCRPPSTRKPLPEEIRTCLPFLKRQIRAIRPEYICAMGPLAAHSLLDTGQSMTLLRGRFHDHDQTRLLVTYHPDHLLRFPEHKRAVWEDMKMLMRHMGINPD